MLNITGLNRKFALIVPTTQDVAGYDDEGKHAKWVGNVLEQFADWFGGASIQAGEGAWKSEAAGIVREANKTVFAFTDSDGVTDHLIDVAELAQAMAIDMGQEAVSMIVNDTLYFIEQDTELKEAA